MLDRRQLLLTFAALPALAVAGAKAASDDAYQFALKDDAGAPLPNYRLPSQLTTQGLPGVLWAGSASPDVTLVEFFDYNCPFCRKGAKDIDGLVKRDPDFRLGLVNNAILSPGSAQAAKVMLAVLKLKGPELAYQLHVRLLTKRGPADGPSALDLAAELGLDRALVEGTGDSQAVIDMLREQTRLAASLGFAATPSFMIEGVGILGYPGARSMGRIVASARKCERVVCP